MNSDLRTVIDTGVVVSAVLLPRSVPRQAFDLAAARGRLLVSDETIAEATTVPQRASHIGAHLRVARHTCVRLQYPGFGACAQSAKALMDSTLGSGDRKKPQ